MNSKLEKTENKNETHEHEEDEEERMVPLENTPCGVFLYEILCFQIRLLQSVSEIFSCCFLGRKTADKTFHIPVKSGFIRGIR